MAHGLDERTKVIIFRSYLRIWFNYGLISSFISLEKGLQKLLLTLAWTEQG